MIQGQSKVGTPCIEMAPHIFQTISSREHPIGLGAIIRTNWSELSSLHVAKADIYVGLLDVAEPGNLGAIIRTMDATGASALLLSGSTVDPYHPSAVKASMGTIFTMPHVALPNAMAMLEWAKINKLQTVASSAHAHVPVDNVSYKFPVLLLMGSEGEGLPIFVMNAADLEVAIPMRGNATSLNLAVAAGIILVRLDAARRQ
jgi:TrmH family RNA methyltransferase